RFGTQSNALRVINHRQVELFLPNISYGSVQIGVGMLIIEPNGFRQTLDGAIVVPGIDVDNAPRTMGVCVRRRHLNGFSYVSMRSNMLLHPTQGKTSVYIRLYACRVRVNRTPEIFYGLVIPLQIVVCNPSSTISTAQILQPKPNCHAVVVCRFVEL